MYLLKECWLKKELVWSRHFNSLLILRSFFLLSTHLESLVTLVQVEASKLPRLQRVNGRQHPILKLVNLILKVIELFEHPLEHAAMLRGCVADFVVAGVQGVHLGLQGFGNLGLTGTDQIGS